MKIELPQVGESVTEGVIGKWLKQVGDRVEKYEPLVEVITDKVNMEMPSPVTGVLTTILAADGDTVPMGTAIAEIAVEGGEEADAAPEATVSPAAPTPPESVDRIGTLLRDVAPVGPTGSGRPISANPEPRGTSAAATPRYSPVVSRLADEHRVDLTAVHGSGIGGRVTRKDVQAVIDAQPAATDEDVAAEEERVPITPVRRTIADNMVKSATEIPQAWTMMEADVTSLTLLRDRVKEELRQRDGTNLTYLPFVLRAVAESLAEHGRVNSAWGGDAIILKRRINLGVAVAAPSGLVVPVIHDADSMGIAELGHAVEDLASRARVGKLTLPEVQGGTFTVNNTGAFGSVIGKPLINPPQAAIMNTEAVVKRPVVIADAIAIREMMNLCLTFDHRVLDGVEAGAFLTSVKGRLEAVWPEDAV